MSIAENGVGEQIREEDRHGDSQDLALIKEQTFESLQILRNLLSLLMPKDDDDGPKLVDLIAALVAQQHDILIGIKRLQSDVNSLSDRMGGNSLNDNERGSAG
jgi:hypothetical protein